MSDQNQAPAQVEVCARTKTQRPPATFEAEFTPSGHLLLRTVIVLRRADD
jgi:hypothetical protein